MARRGDTFQNESSTWNCPETGAEFTQLTSASVHSMAFYFEQTSFMADNNRLIFTTQRTAGRGVPSDLYCADVDGKNLVQLTDETCSYCGSIPSPDKAAILFGTRGNSLYALNIDEMKETEVARCEETTVEGLGSLTGDGKHFYSVGQKADGTKTIIRFNTGTGEAVTFADGLPFCHLTVDWGDTLLTFRGPRNADGTGYDYIICDVEGGNIRTWNDVCFAHNTFYGRTAKLQGTMLPPGHGIGIMSFDDFDVQMVCQGPYFWHSGVSEDGDWIIADTNWPDRGLMLVHVPTGRFAPLVLSKSSNGASQQSHPHPSFNRDASKVVYTSDRTGLAQVYLVTIPDEMKHELTTGELTNRLRIDR